MDQSGGKSTPFILRAWREKMTASVPPLPHKNILKYFMQAIDKIIKK